MQSSSDTNELSAETFSSKSITRWLAPLSWVALHSMVHSFIELDKAVVHVIRLVGFL